MYLVLFVLHVADYLDEILAAWDEVGVSGITILLSTGMARYRDRPALQEDFPLIPGLADFIVPLDNTNRTLITILPDDAMVDAVVAATEKIVGDLDLPDTGILAVLPLVRVFGLNRKSES